MKIRSYRPEDEEGWVRCRVLAFLHTAYFDNVLQQKERYDNPSIELVAEVDGQIVGLIDIELEPEAGTVCTDDSVRSGMIWHVAVHPDYQRRGIASNLLQHAELLVSEQNIARLEAWTRDDRWVREWYENNAFQAKTSYFHIYMQNQGEIEQGKLKTSHPQFHPIQAFVHYTGTEVEKIKTKFQRVHECIMYEKLFSLQLSI